MKPYREITFRPPGTKLKVECRVYPTSQAMVAAARKFIGGRYMNVTRNTAAYCEGTVDLIPEGRLAVIFFCQKFLSYGTIAHEFYHAANCLMARRGHDSVPCSLDEATDLEESVAYIMGDMVDIFVKEYFGIQKR